jgi:sulfur carrier protein ThiS
MRVQLELYASLMKHLPPEAQRHRVSAEVPAGTTAVQLLNRYRVPLKQAHLVLRNGVYLDPAQREQTPLEEGDVIAVWPPVAGG